MAQSFLNTGTQQGNFEDLANFIITVNYKRTSFLSKLGTAKAKGIKHEWMTQALKAGAANARAEGYVPSFAAGNTTARVRRNNQVQLLALPLSVSGTQNAVDKAGIGQRSEYDYQKGLKYEELALDCDYELINNTLVTRDGDAGTAGEFDGILNWATGLNANNGLLTEDIFNQLCNTLADAGGDPDIVWCNGFQKRAITGWATPIRRAELEAETYKNKVMVYDGDWGQQSIVWNKHVPTAQIVVAETKYLKAAYLRPVQHIKLGVNGDVDEGLVLSELTLEVQAPQTVGKITSLATAGA